jgi:hypothetical protein
VRGESSLYSRSPASPPPAPPARTSGYGTPAPPRRSRGLVAFAVFVCVSLLVGSVVMLVKRQVAVVSPDESGEKGRAVAIQNVKNLLEWHRNVVVANRRYPPVGGKAFVLWPLVTENVDYDTPGLVPLFFSPADKGALQKAKLEDYRGLTKLALRGSADVSRLTSFVGRRAPDDPSDGPGKMLPGSTPLIGDLHFEGGAIVGFANGEVKWLTRPELGLAEEDPIVAGPESKSPILRDLAE